MSGDEKLVQLLRQAGEKGDAFNLIAGAFLGKTRDSQTTKDDRDKCKRVVYGIVYGIGPSGLAAQIPGMDVPGASKLINSFLHHFSGVKAFLSSCIERARSEGFVKTLLGRRRYLPGISDPDFQIRSEAERKSINSTIQGSAADVIKVHDGAFTKLFLISFWDNSCFMMLQCVFFRLRWSIGTLPIGTMHGARTLLNPLCIQ
jgi:DNA polymerase I-like protein with 3'-5' exonuclease and polymerase domains